MSVVPKTYEEWEHCITVQCGIPLTPAFVAGRIEALEDESDYGTRKFIEHWGEAHHARTLDWFRQAATRLNQPSPRPDQSLSGRLQGAAERLTAQSGTRKHQPQFQTPTTPNPGTKNPRPTT